MKRKLFCLILLISLVSCTNDNTNSSNDVENSSLISEIVSSDENSNNKNSFNWLDSKNEGSLGIIDFSELVN